jgi:hypothetical protein
MIRSIFRWKFLLPVFQSVLAIALWLYIPVQYRKEVLHLLHKPADYPFRFRIYGPREFPPSCEQALYVINFPAFALSRTLINPLLYHLEYSRQAGLGEWEFTLPISDPEALPPRRIFYGVEVEDLIFLGLIALLWFWVGGKIDVGLRRRAGTYKPRRRVYCVLELVVLSAILLHSAAFACWHAARVGWFQHVGIGGLMWPVALLAYIWLVARPELQQTARNYCSLTDRAAGAQP